jgi:xanthosine utilization system XapX-like protein
MTSGWQTSEAHIGTGSVGAIIYVLSLHYATPITVAAVGAIAAIAVGYAACRTTLKLLCKNSLTPSASSAAVGRYLTDRFGSLAVGGSPTSTATASKRADLERVRGS